MGLVRAVATARCGLNGTTSTIIPVIVAVTITAITTVILTLLLCCLIRRWGRWRTLFTGLVVLTIATALYGLAGSIVGVYLASGLHGAALSLIHVSCLGLLSAFPDRTTESMAGYEVCLYG